MFKITIGRTDCHVKLCQHTVLYEVEEIIESAHRVIPVHSLRISNMKKSIMTGSKNERV